MLNEIDLSRVDLNLLVLFEAVLAERHVGRAATRLHLTASAVSHGLGRLRRLLNDPVFLRTPKGVTPSARALELSTPIADLLARTRRVLAASVPFDPSASTRRFVLGAPDGAMVVLLPALLAALADQAPGIDIAARQILPLRGEPSSDRAWREVFGSLDAREVDVAVIPSDVVPSRFACRCVFEEDFVIAVRARHPLRRRPTLERYCEQRHLVVSEDGDPLGFVDELLAREGRSRRVALTVPNFMFALAMLPDSDLACALPRRLVAMHGARFGVAAIEPPLSLPRFRLNAVVPRVALLDAGVAWLLDRIERPRRSPSR
jgi:DNA-binding transcriptional LysR family regulator